MTATARKIEDAKIQLPDGKMHYQSLGKGDPIILLHSMASSVWSWSMVMDSLAKKHTVYALDTMGQGDSDKPPRDYSIEDYAESVVNFMKARGIKKATLFGNSVGAVIAAQIAGTKPELVNKLVLVGCPCRETDKERQDALATSRPRYDDKFMPLPRTAEDLKQTYVHTDAHIVAKVNEDTAKAGAWAWKCTVANNEFNVAPVLKKIKAKTLIVYGEKDGLRAKEKTVQGYIKGSELVIIPVAGHLPQVDNPQAFLAAVQPFLG